ncbi:hypothetical protein BKA62DRAFT_718496 [Auriculariales sp. MPI-PUGE-AT-0066]|nr:hypothetical protein BKA62DRAFT_718496 [Auriculariales sp. MPI-PUGE-AT-0066]
MRICPLGSPCGPVDYLARGVASSRWLAAVPVPHIHLQTDEVRLHIFCKTAMTLSGRHCARLHLRTIMAPSETGTGNKSYSYYISSAGSSREDPGPAPFIGSLLPQTPGSGMPPGGWIIPSASDLQQAQLNASPAVNAFNSPPAAHIHPPISCPQPFNTVATHQMVPPPVLPQNIQQKAPQPQPNPAMLSTRPPIVPMPYDFAYHARSSASNPFRAPSSELHAPRPSDNWRLAGGSRTARR